jgi:hypothetical protein
MSDVQQVLEALEIGYDSAQAEAAQYHAAMAGYRPERHAAMDADVEKIAAAITALRAALEQEEQRLVRVPDGLAQSDAQFWLDKRGAIIDACRVQGFTIVTTANGVHLMQLGRIEAKTAALTQQEQEPVAWVDSAELKHLSDDFEPVISKLAISEYDIPLYTTPPRREWQSLSEEEILLISVECAASHQQDDVAFARAVEAALKERNA